MKGRLCFLLTVLTLLLISCSGNSESILLECQGVETTYQIKDGVKGEGEEHKVVKSIMFYKEPHELKINSYYTVLNIREGKLNESEKSKRLAWGVVIDNGIPLFEEDSINEVINAPAPTKETLRTFVIVDKDTLGLDTTKNYKSDDMSSMTKTSISINRISGVYFEKENQNTYYPNYKAIFEIITEGTCKSGKRKF